MPGAVSPGGGHNAHTVRDGPSQAQSFGQPNLGIWGRRFNQWMAFGQYGWPFSIGHPASPVDRFRALARRSRFVRRSRGVRMLAAAVMTLGWPLGSLSTALRTCARMRNRGQVAYGMPVLLDMYRLALRHSIPPLEYALYRFDDAERCRTMHEYVYWNDLPGLAALLAQTGADNRDVQDKDRFAEICAGNGFPHVATLAVFDGGKQTYPATRFIPLASALWTKALRLKGGAGGAKWIRQGDHYCDRTGRMVPAADFAAECRKQDCIVQPFVENHPDIACVSNGALATLRIVTGMNGDDEAEFVAALMGLPHGAHETVVGAILCSVDPTTGRIRSVALPNGERISRHPDTRYPIVDLVLPHWRDSMDLVRRAHATAFPRFAFLGWDIALTQNGPVLLETNSGWGAIYHQMLDGPLGHTAFSRLVSQYV
jgi:hypothetical protein